MSERKSVYDAMRKVLQTCNGRILKLKPERKPIIIHVRITTRKKIPLKDGTRTYELPWSSAFHLPASSRGDLSIVPTQVSFANPTLDSPKEVEKRVDKAIKKLIDCDWSVVFPAVIQYSDQSEEYYEFSAQFHGDSDRDVRKVWVGIEPWSEAAKLDSSPSGMIIWPLSKITADERDPQQSDQSTTSVTASDFTEPGSDPASSNTIDSQVTAGSGR